MPYAGTTLADIDTAKPPSSGVDGTVADMDDSLRETRLCSKNSWSADATLAEHHGDGNHLFKQGTTAARPAAGYAGRLYVNTDVITGHQTMQRDTGSAWASIEVAPYSWRSFGGRRPDILDSGSGAYMPRPLTQAPTIQARLREYFSHTGTFYVAAWVLFENTAVGTATILATLDYEGSAIAAQTIISPLSPSAPIASRLPNAAATYAAFTVASTGWKTLSISAAEAANPGFSAIVGGSYRIYRGL